ncbi:MAG: DNA-binding protein, partial [Bacteroides acidifaciens]
MSVYYDLYASGNPQKNDEQQPLHARVIPSGTLDAKKFIELVS